jgi:hypothetical protein
MDIDAEPANDEHPEGKRRRGRGSDINPSDQKI